ncbi:hypothetical protein A2U01_0049891, partial [Trifolium medium]|nr:hypothetical protein [Trifolium medium]
ALARGPFSIGWRSVRLETLGFLVCVFFMTLALSPSSVRMKLKLVRSKVPGAFYGGGGATTSHISSCMLFSSSKTHSSITFFLYSLK